MSPSSQTASVAGPWRALLPVFAACGAIGLQMGVAIPLVTLALERRAVERGLTTVRLHAPRGWSFAASGDGNVVFWESPAAFLVLVVDSRMGGDRLTRCNLPLATCVLVAG